MEDPGTPEPQRRAPDHSRYQINRLEELQRSLQTPGNRFDSHKPHHILQLFTPLVAYALGIGQNLVEQFGFRGVRGWGGRFEDGICRARWRLGRLVCLHGVGKA